MVGKELPIRDFRSSVALGGKPSNSTRSQFGRKCPRGTDIDQFVNLVCPFRVAIPPLRCYPLNGASIRWREFVGPIGGRVYFM
jgi:hypothetical protein